MKYMWRYLKNRPQIFCQEEIDETNKNLVHLQLSFWEHNLEPIQQWKNGQAKFGKPWKSQLELFYTERLSLTTLSKICLHPSIYCVFLTSLLGLCLCSLTVLSISCSAQYLRMNSLLPFHRASGSIWSMGSKCGKLGGRVWGKEETIISLLLLYLWLHL